MNEREIQASDIEREHLAGVRPWRQAAYLFGVLAGGLGAMLALIALLGSGS